MIRLSSYFRSRLEVSHYYDLSCRLPTTRPRRPFLLHLFEFVIDVEVWNIFPYREKSLMGVFVMRVVIVTVQR
jgi:hypothetical protein